jgi:hypothetical protein
VDSFVQIFQLKFWIHFRSLNVAFNLEVLRVGLLSIPCGIKNKDLAVNISVIHLVLTFLCLILEMDTLSKPLQ